eukprot:6691912-Alexandrium_andersonii.AAC.1
MSPASRSSSPLLTPRASRALPGRGVTGTTSSPCWTGGGSDLGRSAMAPRRCAAAASLALRSKTEL